jgi:hypothetical protein
MCKIVTVLSPVPDLIENAQRYEIYAVLLPIYMAATAVEKMFKYCGGVLDVFRILNPQSSFNYMSKFYFLHLRAISSLKF